MLHTQLTRAYKLEKVKKNALYKSSEPNKSHNMLKSRIYTVFLTLFSAIVLLFVGLMQKG